MMVANFDSVSQAELWNTVGAAEGAARMKAAVRMADLIGGVTVVTDAQVLDGIFFLTAGPDAIVRMLGRDDGDAVPLVIASDHGSLANSLESMRGRADFIWSSADAAGAAGVAEVDLDSRRAAWINAEVEGRVRVQDLTDRPLVLQGALAALPAPPHADSDLEAALRKARRRSEAYGVIYENFEKASVEAAALRRWVNHGYAAAQAVQHDASWLQLGSQREGDLPGATTRAPKLRNRSNERLAHPLGGQLLDELATIAAPLYALIRQRSEKSRAEWSAGRHHESLRTLALVVRSVLAPSHTWRQAAVITFLQASAFTVVSVFAIVGELHPRLDWLFAVAIISILIKDMPWGAWMGLLEARPGLLWGVVHVDLD